MVGETTRKITQSVLHSVDSGSHTCSVMDYIGRSGTSIVDISLSG